MAKIKSDEPTIPDLTQIRAALVAAREVLAEVADPELEGAAWVQAIPTPMKSRVLEVIPKARAALAQIDAALKGPVDG